MGLSGSTSFTRHVFATLTYSQKETSEQTWARCSKDYNRYIQRLRRSPQLGSQLGYLRVVEQHKSGYPHIHAILQARSASFVVVLGSDRRGRSRYYFDPKLYGFLRDSWGFGHSDFVRPYQSGLGALVYCLKYITKSGMSSTVLNVYKKTFHGITRTPSFTISPPDSSPSMNAKTAASPSLPTHYRGLKLCSWSRNFDFSVFRPIIKAPPRRGGQGGEYLKTKQKETKALSKSRLVTQEGRPW